MASCRNYRAQVLCEPLEVAFYIFLSSFICYLLIKSNINPLWDNISTGLCVKFQTKENNCTHGCFCFVRSTRGLNSISLPTGGMDTVCNVWNPVAFIEEGK